EEAALLRAGAAVFRGDTYRVTRSNGAKFVTGEQMLDYRYLPTASWPRGFWRRGACGHFPTVCRRICASSRGWENIGQWPVLISTSRQCLVSSSATSSSSSAPASRHWMYVAGRL